jgi:hypothetical protein
LSADCLDYEVDIFRQERTDIVGEQTGGKRESAIARCVSHEHAHNFDPQAVPGSDCVAALIEEPDECASDNTAAGK